MSGAITAAVIAAGGMAYSANEQSEAAENAAALGMHGQLGAADAATAANEQAMQAQLQAAAMQDERLREFYDRSRMAMIPQQVAGNRAMSQLSSLLGMGQLPINAPWEAERIRLDYVPGGQEAPEKLDLEGYLGTDAARQRATALLDKYYEEKAQVSSMDYHGANKHAKRAAKKRLRRKYPGSVIQDLKKFSSTGDVRAIMKDRKSRDFMQRKAYNPYASEYDQRQLYGQGQAGGVPTLSPEQMAERNARLQALLPDESFEELSPEAAQERAFEQFKTSPGYEFRLSEGEKAIRRLSSARGMLGSGSMYKDLMKYGQGLASDEYGNYVSQLQSMAGLAPTTSSALANLNLSTGQQMANVLQGAADARSSGYTGIGQAQANAMLGMSNIAGQNALTQAQIRGDMATDMSSMLAAGISGYGGNTGGGGNYWTSQEGQTYFDSLY